LYDLQGRDGFEGRDLEYRPRYPGALSQQVLAVINDGQRRSEYLRWGLIPLRVKDPKVGHRMINALGEAAATKWRRA
jgi:putative SOS response-associated peptidase YedK